jgi:hypothetical protein
MQLSSPPKQEYILRPNAHVPRMHTNDAIGGDPANIQSTGESLVSGSRHIAYKHAPSTEPMFSYQDMPSTPGRVFHGHSRKGTREAHNDDGVEGMELSDFRGRRVHAHPRHSVTHQTAVRPMILAETYGTSNSGTPRSSIGPFSRNDGPANPKRLTVDSLWKNFYEPDPSYIPRHPTSQYGWRRVSAPPDIEYAQDPKDMYARRSPDVEAPPSPQNKLIAAEMIRQQKLRRGNWWQRLLGRKEAGYYPSRFIFFGCFFFYPALLGYWAGTFDPLVRHIARVNGAADVRGCPPHLKRYALIVACAMFASTLVIIAFVVALYCKGLLVALSA